MKKMTERNPHTGEKLQSKANSDAYRGAHDRIFKKAPCKQCGAKPDSWPNCDAPKCVNNDNRAN